MPFISLMLAYLLNIIMQTLTVLLPMLLTGAYSMICWLLAEPIVMPIWNNFIKPLYFKCLQGVQNFGSACSTRWHNFWNPSEVPPAATTNEAPIVEIKSIPQRIKALLFRKSTHVASQDIAPQGIVHKASSRNTLV